MIEFININNAKPYKLFHDYYKTAQNAKQKIIEAIAISSYSKTLKEVDARFVNLKYVNDDEFIFFSNYNSPKANAFSEHSQISALMFWNSINVQIRMKASIEKTSRGYNQKYFSQREKNKNALAISSNQSNKIKSYSLIEKRYKETLESQNLSKCPDYWGGFSFKPYYFEFWEGHEFRLNKRDVYEIDNGNWKHTILEP
jgi:pyridoxamine 5'-phosphate oxidase